MAHRSGSASLSSVSFQQLDPRQQLDPLEKLEHGQGVRPDREEASNDDDQGPESEELVRLLVSGLVLLPLALLVGLPRRREEHSVPVHDPPPVDQATTDHQHRRQQHGAEHLVGEEHSRDVEPGGGEGRGHEGGEGDDRVGAQERRGKCVPGEATGPGHPDVLRGGPLRLLWPKQAQNRQAKNQQRGHECDAPQGVVVKLGNLGALEAHPGERQVQRHVEQRQAESLGGDQTPTEGSRDLARPAEVGLGKTAGSEDLTDRLEEKGHQGDVREGAARG